MGKYKQNYRCCSRSNDLVKERGNVAKSETVFGPNSSVEEKAATSAALPYDVIK